MFRNVIPLEKAVTFLYMYRVFQGGLNMDLFLTFLLLWKKFKITNQCISSRIQKRYQKTFGLKKKDRVFFKWNNNNFLHDFWIYGFFD